MPEFTIKCRREDVSDGYHTMAELYDHRCHLLILAMRSKPHISWRARAHHDGIENPDWFLAGMELPSGQISYHIPSYMWEFLDRSDVATHDRAPRWDGHGSKDVLNRLEALFRMESQ